MQKLEIIEELSVRNSLIERVDVLDKVKQIVYFGNTDYITVNLALKYYGVNESTLKMLLKNNKSELITDGLKVLNYNDMKQFCESNKLTYNKKTRSMVLIPKRALLRIGMLLRDSEVAKEVRTMLLDNHEKLSNLHNDLKNGVEIDIDKTSPTYFVDKEKSILEQKQLLVKDICDALINADINRESMLKSKLISLEHELTELEKERASMYEDKADKFDIYLDSNGLTTVDQLSKTLAIKKLGKNNLYKLLREQGYLRSDGHNKNIPYQKYVDRGLFELCVTGSFEINDKTYNSYLSHVTSKGVEHIIELVKKLGYTVK